MSTHSLVEVHRERSRDGSHYLIVNWCSSCGAVVIDGESDGRILPGHFAQMHRPAMTQNLACTGATP